MSAEEVQGLPSGPEATVRQAAMAVDLGRNRGVKRQILELPWPLSGASELDDWCDPHTRVSVPPYISCRHGSSIVYLALFWIRLTLGIGNGEDLQTVFQNLLSDILSNPRPGGIMQEYNTAKPIVEQLLRSVGKDMELETPFTFKILDDSDAVVAWQQDTILAVLFPTGDTLREVPSIMLLPL